MQDSVITGALQMETRKNFEGVSAPHKTQKSPMQPEVSTENATNNVGKSW